ncbi:GntR family transcriptional regulator [Streptomyces xanthochromogenes]|uniref:FadR/GntR family transcriptional regulator n=1 Tax=Streptomyces xanthochromogenes TaxID=67384 RepID=UPI0019A2F0BB|nr:FadR/GntR family transcriptional regulator [Streptomyces xanthochromogenes]GHB25239.1 GntR family transcriptional regulator [Streptomyces xanthochromogenes]
MSEAAYVGRGVHRTAVEGLALRIFDGTYDEGDTLELPALMAELGVSQTVLREAVKVLTAKGLLDARQKRGTFVRPRADWNLLDSDVLRWKLAAGAPPDFFADVLELRRAIEPAAASLAAEHRTEEDLAALDGSLTAMRSAGADPVLAVRADTAFHSALLTASHNRFFVQLRRVIVPALVARGGHGSSGGQAGPVPAHAEVVRSVREGDGDGAYMAVLELLDLPAGDRGAGA